MGPLTKKEAAKLGYKISKGKEIGSEPSNHSRYYLIYKNEIIGPAGAGFKSIDDALGEVFERVINRNNNIDISIN